MEVISKISFCLLLLISITYGYQQFTIFHVTDVHGWVFGHPHNATLNADFGDFASLLEHMKSNAEANGDIFLTFDTGDLIEGTGLSDATPIHGEYIFPIIQKVKNYDALTMGNHDIGHDNTINLMRSGFIQSWNGSYLTANSLDKATMTTLGAPYYTMQAGKYNILTIGYIYNFTQNCNDTVVTPVSDSLLEEYFKDAMAVPNIDIIIVLAHIDPQSGVELDQIYNAIRNAKPNLPLVLLSGHRHVKYFHWYDWNAFTIESHCYFQSLGVVNFYIDDKGEFADFSHQWIDTSREEFMNISGTDESNFLTQTGQEVKDLINFYYDKLNLNETVGCSPMTYNPYVEISEGDSLYNLYVNEVVPKYVFESSDSAVDIYFCNPFTLRGYLYEGRVTKNDILSVIPFGDTFYYYSLTGNQLSQFTNAINKYQEFYYTNVTVSGSDSVNLICSQYDTAKITKILDQMFSDSFTATPYANTISSTTALWNYVSNEMPC